MIAEMICAVRQYASAKYPGMIADMPQSPDDPMQLKARLRAIGETQQALARALGWTIHKVGRIANGERAALTSEEERQIEAFFQGREGGQKPGGAKVLSFIPQGQVPLYGFAAGAPFGPIHLNHDVAMEYVDRHPRQGRNADAFAVRVWGESMSPRYEPGDIAYCVREQFPRRMEDVVIEMKNGDAWIKRYVGMTNGMVTLEQLNPPEGEERLVYLKSSEVKALHAVVGRG